MNKKNKKNEKEELSPLYKKLSLGPEIRAEEPKGVYPQGRAKQVFAVFGAEMNSLMRVNAWFLIFALPLFFVLYWCSNYFVTQAVSRFNFMGNIGMAYPGGADTLQQAQVAVYNAWQYVFYLFIPAFTLTFIGMAGAFNCLKAFMWGEKVEKVTKTFFKGVKKFWWRYLIVAIIDALLIFALGSAFIYFLKLKALGALTAGHWVMIVVVCIAEFLVLYLNMQLLPMIAEVDLPFMKQVKDSILFSVKLAPIGLPLFLVCLAPFALFFVKSSFFTVIWLVVMVMFGLTLYGLVFTAFSQWALDNVLTPLYMMTQQKPSSKKEKKAKQQNAISDKNTAENEKSASENPEISDNSNINNNKNTNNANPKQNVKKKKGGKK